ncbi:hypothetical protein Daus18300_010995 [Diaporthe australafricana]|uniref:BTB domain-containing protein n=1 Tax=Diaporthe australafricana TaxID=127596 RepID=A0ABR3W869_9PEZI
MAASFADKSQSSMFTFVVGERKTEYRVHGQYVSALSVALDLFLAGGVNAGKVRVEWPDVDDHTFVRFIQWAYSRNYDPREPQNDSKRTKVGGLPTSLPSAPDTNSPTSSEKRLCGLSSPESLTKRSCIPAESVPGSFAHEAGKKYPAPASSIVFTPRQNTTSSEDFTEVLLCHAKLYVVGDNWLIPQLKQLTLHRLYATLRHFILYPSRVQDICVLAEYVFENTTPGDEMRDLVIMYFASVIDRVTDCSGVEALMDKVPGFAFQLVKMMSRKSKPIFSIY